MITSARLFGRLALLLLAPIFTGFHTTASAQTAMSLLTTVAQVKNLTPSQAVTGYPVRLQGIVTFYDDSLPMLCIQDESGGISVELEQQNPKLQTGQLVEIEGISINGSFLPIISQARVRIIENSGFPQSRKTSLSLVKLNNDESRWMQFQVLVQNVYKEGRYIVLDAYEGKRRINLRIKGFSSLLADDLVDTVVNIYGVLGIITDSAKKPIGFTLWVPDASCLTVSSRPTIPPSQIPIIPIADIGDNWRTSPPRHRIRIQGAVTPGEKETTLIVQDKTGNILTEPLFARPIAPGDEVDLIGFADLSSPFPKIINATYLRIKAVAIQNKEEQGLPALTKISEIRKLDAKEAARGYPVKVKGIITYHNPQLSMTFIQNGPDAIYLQSLDTMLSLEEGMEYEVEGYTAPGDFAPIIVKPKYRALGKAPLPPAVSVNLDQLASGRYDCARVQAQGIIRSIRQVGNRWCLGLFDNGKEIQVWTPNLPESNVLSLQDAKVLARGICSIQISSLGTISGFRINVSSMNELNVLEPAKFDPFSAPLRSIRDVFRNTDQSISGHRIRIQGIVLHQQPGKALYLRDDTGSIAIPINHLEPVNANDLVIISGYPVSGAPAATLENTLIKRLSTKPPPPARMLNDVHAIYNTFQGDLVRIQARLVDQWQGAEAQFYLLQDINKSSTVFEAYLEKSTEPSVIASLRNGSELELTGIYLLQTKSDQKFGFQLLLRTPEDIRIVKNAPWWTLQHIYLALAILVLLSLFTFTWVVMLRKRVHRQTTTIQQRLEAEAALEKKYRDLFEKSNDIVFACDSDGRLKSINPAGERLLGYSNQESVGIDLKQMMSPSSIITISGWIEKKQKGNESSPVECELTVKDGRKIQVEVNGELIQAEERIIGAQGIARDITERKNAEEALRLSEEKLRQGQKLEAIGKLAGGIAHDFNNILSAIMGYAELSMEEMQPDDPINTNMEQIVKAAHRARDLVQQILAFSRKLERERRPIRLQTVIEEGLKLLKATLPATIQMLIKIDAACGPVMADQTQMHQILLNLATNAAHAMNFTGGSMHIELEQIELKTKLPSALPELPQGTYARLTVSDTGPGIDPDIQKRIFEPYFTTKSVGEGSGLGLAVVHGIVQSHGGGIVLISAPGHGTCFQVYLPCCSESGVEIQTTPSASVKVQGKGRILIVDDEETIVQLGQKSLERLGYQVTCETHSVKALESFTKNPMQFDVVVTDQTMPNLTGTSLATALWKIRPNLPIIISTGYSEQLTQEKAVTLGFQALLSKPYSATELAQAIQQSLSAKVLGSASK
jgi:PAS domain S-box-containing protein